jgi:hypothetical protein
LPNPTAAGRERNGGFKMPNNARQTFMTYPAMQVSAHCSTPFASRWLAELV